MIEAVILVEFDLLDLAGDPVTLRFSDRAIAPFPPDDPTAPNVAYEERLIEPPLFRRELFADVETLQPGFGVGEAVLANADRALDQYQGHSWGEVRVLRWTPGTPRSAAKRIITGLAELPRFDSKSTTAARVRVPLYDYRTELDRPLQETRFTEGSGWNSAALLNQPVPIGFGSLRNAHVPAPITDSAELVYQLHDGPLSALPGDAVTVFDRGDDAGLIYDGDFSGSAFDDHAPDSAHYATDLGRALVKMNANPVGQVAFGFWSVAPNGPTWRTGGAAADVLARAGVPPERISSDMPTTPRPTAAGTAVGTIASLWVGGEVAAREVLAALARGIPGAVLPNRLGVWEAVMLGAPVGDPDHLIEQDEIMALEASAEVAGPAAEVRLGYSPIYARYRPADLAPELAPGSKQDLASEYRWALAEDGAVKTRFPKSWRTVTLEMPIQDSAIYMDELAYVLLERVFGPRANGAPRRAWRITLEMTDARLSAELGQLVEIEAAQWGIEGVFTLIGEELMRPGRDQVIWTVWG